MSKINLIDKNFAYMKKIAEEALKWPDWKLNLSGIDSYTDFNCEKNNKKITLPIDK